MADIHAVIDAIPVLSGSRPLRALPGGPASDSWLVDGPEGRLVVRLDRPLATRLGLDRAREFAVLHIAHAAGFAPEPLGFADGVLVSRWLEGPVWTEEQLSAPGRLEMAGRLLRGVHDLPAPRSALDPLAAAIRYAGCVPGEDSTAVLREIEALTAGLYQRSASCLCHHDPTAANLLGVEGPVLLDWEYAQGGQPLFDLAVMVVHHELTAAQARHLLAAWADGADPGLMEQLDAFCRLYRLLAGLWERAAATG